MFTRNSKMYWKKQLLVLLSFIIVAGGFPAVLVPQAVKAATTTTVAPGGVSDGLISWVNVERSADVDASNKINKLTDLIDGGVWILTGAANDNLPNALNFNVGMHMGAQGYYTRLASQFSNDSAREVFSVQASDGVLSTTNDYRGFPWEFGGKHNTPSVYGTTVDGKDIRTYFGRSLGTLDASVGDYDLKDGAMLNVWSAPNDWGLSLNGKNLKKTDVNTPSFTPDPKTGNSYYFGAGHMNRFYGMMAETILYNHKLSDEDRKKVNSYLALKYGLTLKDEFGQPTDYVDSAGNLMWSKENIGNYAYRITGIGKDTASGLEQRQSKSEESGALVTIALGNGVATSNAEATPFPGNVDNTYLAFSDNNESTDYQLSDIEEPVTGHQLKKMDRVFKAQKSDNWPGGNVTLKLDVTPDADPPVFNYYLLTSSDGLTFDQPPVEFKLNDNFEVTLNSDHLQYFTFAKVHKEDLKALVDGLQPYEEDHYTVDSWNTFETAKTNAEGILAKGEASQEEVDDARDALQAGVEGLTLKTPQVAELDIQAKTITIPFDYDVTLNQLKEGFTVKIDGQEPAVDIDNITFDPASKTLTIALPANVTLSEDSRVSVDYQATSENVKGPYDKAVGDFALVAEDPFAAALQIKQPKNLIVTEKQPTISGTAEQGSTVTVTIKKPDGTEVAKGGGTIAADGTWLFDPSVELDRGDYVIEVIASNGNGKSVTKKKDLKVVDKIALDQKVKEIDDMALVEADYTPETWTALQEALAEARTVLGNETADQVEIDRALGVLEKAFETLTLVLEIQEPATEIISISNPGFSGKTAKDAEVKVTITNENGTSIGPVQAEVAVDGTWTLVPGDLEDGKYTLEVIATKGDVETRVEKGFTIGTSLPKLVITEPSADTVYTAKPVIKGTADKDAKVKVTLTKEDGTSIGPVQVGVAQDGTWTFIPADALEDGKYTIDVTAEKYGKVSKVTRNITVDTVNVVDKTALKQKADDTAGKITAGELAKSNYTPESWANLDRALTEADSVLNDSNATQAEVDQALIDLEKALGNLVVLGVELDGLKLKGLTNDGDTDLLLNPEFNPNRYKNYYGTVTSDVYGVSLDPRALYPNDTFVEVSLNNSEVSTGQWGKLPLEEGENTIKVTVKDKNGTKLNEYTITIVRASETDANKLKSLVPSTGRLVPVFEPNLYSYTMGVGNSVDRLKLTPAAFDANAKIEIRLENGDWQEVASGNTSDNLMLNVGSNKITVRVTDQDGNFKEYVLTVTRAAGNNSGSGSTGGSNSGNGNTATPSTPVNSVKPGNIVSTINDEHASFATGTVTQTGDRTNTTVTIDPDKLAGILEGGQGQKLGIRVPGNGDVVVQGLTVEDLKKIADTGSSLEVEDLLAIYPVPSGQLDLNAISNRFGNAPLGDIAVNIQIKRSSDDFMQLASKAAANDGYELLVHPVDIDLAFAHGGQTDRAGELNGYGVKYIALPEGIDPNRITTGVIVNPDGTVFHVPTVVTKMNNRYFAKINDLRSQGTYSVIWNPKDFNDVKNHWAKTSVNDIGARLGIEGTGNNNFTPDRDVNRSEFAVFIVKGLGIMRQNVDDNVFHDVSSAAYYHAAVTIANEYGIILGYDDGAFHGEQYITREQGMAIIARAYELIRPEVTMSSEQVNEVLSAFGDANEVAPWAREAVALLVSEGITEGKNGKMLKPEDKMTRAEAAALIQRLLKTTDLID